jgi:hypothetical protein
MIVSSRSVHSPRGILRERVADDIYTFLGGYFVQGSHPVFTCTSLFVGATQGS